MKRITLRAALLTFIAGILISWSGERNYFAVRANQTPNSPRARSKLTGKLELEFIQFISNQYHTYAQLRVMNGRSETVRFPGYAKNSNCLIFIRRDIFIQPAASTQTINNFGAQSLSSGDSAIFDVQIPEGEGAFQVGFGYEVGAKHLWKIVWSGKIEPAAK